MAGRRLRVRIVGLQPGESWGAVAHLSALRALADDYEIVGVANTSHESARAAAAACDIPRAFRDVAELVDSPEIDVVVITVKVPHHHEIVTQAIGGARPCTASGLSATDSWRRGDWPTSRATSGS